MKRNTTGKQRGVALLVVLILLVMMSALAARISQQFCRNLQKTRYQVSQQQLRWALQGQQKAINDALQSAGSGPDNALTPDGEWHQPLETKGENYTLVSQLEDAQNCFNVNSLLAEEPVKPQESGTLPSKPLKQQMVEQLLVDSGVSTTAAEEVYQQLMDYLDADSLTDKQGQESDAWASTQPHRLPANQMMRTLSEIKQLPAFPAAAWAKASLFFCALPDTRNLVDVNTLKPEQAPLLAALFAGKLNTDDATRLLASRPEEGWASTEAFGKVLENEYPQTKEGLAQSLTAISVSSRYFQLNSTGSSDDLTLRIVSQLYLDNESGEIITWQRRYRMVE